MIEHGKQPGGQGEPVDGDKLTWIALLGQWVEFAQSALALPDDVDGRRLRDSVADIIMLQAVWYALRHLEELPGEQRAVGVDRAQLLIDKHAQTLMRRWPNQVMPARLHEIIEDANNLLAKVSAGTDPPFR